MTARITTTIDTRAFKAGVMQTKAAMAMGTIRAVRVALSEGANYARDHHAHTKRTGNLTSRENLFGEMRQADATGAWGYLINKAPYARIIEYGSKAHDIYPKAGFQMIGPTRNGQTRRATGRGPHEHIVGRGLALRFRVGGRIVFARMVKHPGTPALAFMRPAADYAGEVIERETEAVTFRMMQQVWDE